MSRFVVVFLMLASLAAGVGTAGGEEINMDYGRV